MLETVSIAYYSQNAHKAIVMDIRVLFGRHLKRLREDRELTQEELAEAIGVTPQHLSDIERGRYSPGFTRLPQIAHALHVQIKDLFDF